MSHLTDDQLVLFRYDESPDPARVRAHLAECAACRAELDALGRVLAQVDAEAAPARDASYGAEVWRAIEGRLDAPPSPRRGWWAPSPWPRSAGGWARWIVPQAALAGAVAAALLVALGTPLRPAPPALAQDNVLVGAVEDHLERTGLMLAELNNTDDAATVPEVRVWAEDLATANRLYRQSATLAGDERIGRLLDDLERVLIEVAHAPDDAGSGDVESLRGRLDTREVAFKVRVASAELRSRDGAAPANRDRRAARLAGTDAGTGTGL